MSVGFTGYRYEKLPFTRQDTAAIALLQAKLRDACVSAIDAGHTRFICGFAQGSDLLFAQTVVNLQAEYPNITLDAALPFPAPHLRYLRADMLDYARLLPRCDVVTEVFPRMRRGCYLLRNDFILDQSTLLLAVFDGKPGGTAYTVGQARRRGMRTVLIPPPNGAKETL